MISRFSRIALTSVALFGALRLVAEPAPAQPVPDTLDLPTTLRYALDNNFAIRQAKERIRQQEGVVLEVRAQQLPFVGVGAGYQRNDKDIAQTVPQDDSAWNIQIQASQALYAGGGIKSSVASANLVKEAAVLELQSVVNNALLEVRVRFYNVLLARESIKVREQSVELLKEQLQNARNRFEAGASSSFEVLRAEVALANAQPALIQARNAFRISIEELRQSLGYTNKEGANLNKVPEFVGDLSFEPTSFDLQSSLESARLNRPELSRLAKIESAREQGITIARSTYYPSVDAVAGYQWRKTGTSDRFGDAAHGWLVGLQSQWSIFDGRATAGRVIQARSALAQAQLSTDEAELAVDVEVRRALSSLQEAQELADASGKVVSQAEEALRLATVRQTAGTATQLDVLTSQVDLTQARNNQLQANYNYLVALAQMKRAVGQADVYSSSN